MKKIVTVMLCMLMSFGLVGCNLLKKPSETANESADVRDDSSDIADTTEAVPTTEEFPKQDKPTPSDTITMTSLTPNTAGIKILGERYYTSNDEQQINCDWTCSGIEFVLNSSGGDIIFQAGSDKPCYFRAYVNGVEWKNADSDYYTVDGNSKITLKNVPAGEQTIRLIKVTGILLGNAQLYNVSYKGEIVETAPVDKDVYIEFLGDSISCGWGVVGPKDYTYAAQDGSLAYPYLLSQRLNVDYSILGLSGQGVIFHGTGIPNMTDAYPKSSPIRSETDLYGFDRKADVVVVNIGTNDYTYRQGAGITEQMFADAYKALLQSILDANGADCKIVCLYNTMNDTFGDAIPNVCNELGGTDAGIYSFKMNRTSMGGPAGHPTVEENVAYADALESFIREVIQTGKNPGNTTDGTAVWTPFV